MEGNRGILTATKPAVCSQQLAEDVRKPLEGPSLPGRAAGAPRSRWARRLVSGRGFGRADFSTRSKTSAEPRGQQRGRRARRPCPARGRARPLMVAEAGTSRANVGRLEKLHNPQINSGNKWGSKIGSDKLKKRQGMRENAKAKKKQTLRSQWKHTRVRIALV